MRNQWVDIDVSSSKTNIEAGPRSKNDNMNIDLYQNNEGSSEHILHILCSSYMDGKDIVCVTRITNKLTGELIFEYESSR